MSGGYQRGKECARAFISRWKDFDNRSLRIVIEDFRKRGRGERTFRFTNAGKLRFVAGIVSTVLKYPSLELTRADYAQLCGIRKGTLEKLLEMDLSLRDILEGKEEKEGPGPRKPGPPGDLILVVLRDIELKKLMKDDADFCRGFSDEFLECIRNDDAVISRSLERLGREFLRTSQSRAMLLALKEYRKVLNETKSRIKEFCEHKTDPRHHPEYRPESNPAYRVTKPLLVQNGEKVAAFLTALRDETRAAVKNVKHGKFDSRLADSVIRVDIPEIYSLYSDFLRIAAMLYFVSPWAGDEFVKYTEFFKPPSG